MSLDSLHKKLNKFNDEIISLKNVASQKEEKKELKNKVLSNAENLYNKLYCIYKDKYNKEINTLDTKNKEKLDYKKLRLSDYQYLSEEEQEKQKPTKDDAIALNKQIIDEETDINGYKLELLTPETIKLLGSTKKVVGKDKNGEMYLS